MEEKIGSNRQHKLILQNRSKGNITGICDVVSFDENAVVLDTDMGPVSYTHLCSTFRSICGRGKDKGTL